MGARLLVALCAIIFGSSSATSLDIALEAVAAKPSSGLRRPLCTAGVEMTGFQYPGLFRAPKELEVMKSGARVSCGRLTASNYAVLSTYAATCPKPRPNFMDITTGGQDTCKYVTADTNHPCCQTNFQVIQPLNVTSLFGQQFVVRHYNYSVQVAHVGTCDSVNTACSNGGHCVQEYRVDWLLVVGCPDSFIPVELPNHCVCVFT